jgi:hypothetical protein
MEAKFYYAGLPSAPLLVARTGTTSWKAPIGRSWQQDGVMGTRDYTSSPTLPFYKAEFLNTSIIVAKHGRFKVVKRTVRVPKRLLKLK